MERNFLLPTKVRTIKEELGEEEFRRLIQCLPIKEKQEPTLSIDTIPEDIRAILDDAYAKNKKSIIVTKEKDPNIDQTGYRLTYDNSAGILEKGQLEKLIAHPNFKSLTIKAIDFKNSGYLEDK